MTRLRRTQPKNKKTDRMLNARRGILLDLSSAVREKDPNYIRLGRAEDFEVDIVHDPTIVPYPFDADSCFTILARHVIEHIPRDDRRLLRVMDEWWRILKPTGQLIATSLYGQNFQHDPGACASVTEQTFMYFDPTHPSGLYRRYQPKPWKIQQRAYSHNGTIEIRLTKIIQK